MIYKCLTLNPVSYIDFEIVQCISMEFDEMSFYIRDLDQCDSDEVDLVVNRAMETVLETIPEFEGKKENALKIWSNFTFEQMKAMFVKDFDSLAHRIFVAVDDSTQKVVGHAICSYKTDDAGERYGFVFQDIFIPILEEGDSPINYIMNKNYGGEKIVQNILSLKLMRLISS